MLMAERGHVEEESNLFQLFKCRSKDVPALGWLPDGRYRSSVGNDSTNGISG